MSKCKYWKICDLYIESSITCNENAGMYYEDGKRPAGCFREKELNIKET